MNLDKLNQQLNEIEGYIPEMEVRNRKISTANVSWHLDHSLKVINGILKSLQESDPRDYNKKFNFYKTLVFLTGKIPRGKARAPKAVLPPAKIEANDIRSQAKMAREYLSGIEELNERSFFNHPYFKHLNRDQTRRFLEIHTEHHLKIVRDIMKNEPH